MGISIFNFMRDRLTVRMLESESSDAGSSPAPATITIPEAEIEIIESDDAFEEVVEDVDEVEVEELISPSPYIEYVHSDNIISVTQDSIDQIIEDAVQLALTAEAEAEAEEEAEEEVEEEAEEEESEAEAEEVVESEEGTEEGLSYDQLMMESIEVLNENMIHQTEIQIGFVGIIVGLLIGIEVFKSWLV